MEGLRVGCQCGRLGEARAAITRSGVIEPASRCGLERDAMLERGSTRHRDGIGVRGRFDEHRTALGVFEDEFQRVAGKPCVDRHRNCASTHRAKKDLEKLDPVADDHADAVTSADTEAREEPCDAVGALIELRVGDEALDAAVEVDDRYLVREALDRAREEVA